VNLASAAGIGGRDEGRFRRGRWRGRAELVTASLPRPLSAPTGGFGACWSLMSFQSCTKAEPHRIGSRRISSALVPPLRNRVLSDNLKGD
jgi:hypothetical protein